MWGSEQTRLAGFLQTLDVTRKCTDGPGEGSGPEQSLAMKDSLSGVPPRGFCLPWVTQSGCGVTSETLRSPQPLGHKGCGPQGSAPTLLLGESGPCLGPECKSSKSQYNMYSACFLSTLRAEEPGLRGRGRAPFGSC